MNRASTLCVIGVIAAAETISLRADAISTGNLVVQTSTNRFLPTTAIGNACVTGQLGSGFGGIATAADWRSLAAPGFTDLGDPVGCTNQLFVRSANQPSIFYTYYDLNSYLGYRGDLPAAKFPAPVSAGDLITADLPGFTPDAVGEGKFVSSETSVGGVLTFRSATLTSNEASPQTDEMYHVTAAA